MRQIEGKYILPAILGMLLFLPETNAIIPDRNYIRLPQNAGHRGTDAPYFFDTTRYVEETVTFMTEAPCFGR